MPITPIAIYSFDVERIWFGPTAFVTYHSNQLSLYSYPNLQLHKEPSLASIDNVEFTETVRIIFIDRTLSTLPTKISPIVPSPFRLYDDHVYYMNNKLFHIEGTYNIHIVGLKLYRTILTATHYAIEEYNLFIVENGIIFSSSFFKKYVPYSCSYKYATNSVDFCICSGNLVTFNMKEKLMLKEIINKVTMTANNIIIYVKKDNYTFNIILDRTLKEVFSGVNVPLITNMHQGVLFFDRNKTFYLDGSKMILKTNIFDFKNYMLKSKANKQRITFTKHLDNFKFFVYDNNRLVEFQSYNNIIQDKNTRSNYKNVAGNIIKEDFDICKDKEIIPDNQEEDELLKIKNGSQEENESFRINYDKKEENDNQEENETFKIKKDSQEENESFRIKNDNQENDELFKIKSNEKDENESFKNNNKVYLNCEDYTEKLYDQTGTKIETIFEYELFDDILNITDIILFDGFENRWLLVTANFIILKVNRTICRMKKPEKNIIHCNCKDFLLVSIEDGHRNEITILNMLFCILTVESGPGVWADDLGYNKYHDQEDFQYRLENFIHRLLKDHKKRASIILKNIQNEDVVCLLYRKGDNQIRCDLELILGADYFRKNISARNMAIIFLYCDIDLKMFIEKCCFECEEKIMEIYDYFYEHHKSMANEIVDILWSMGNFKVIAAIENIDLKKYENLEKLLQRM